MSVQLDLSRFGFAVLVGMTIPIFFVLIRDDETFSSTTTGYIFVGIGFVLLLIAYAVSIHYGITFEALGEDRAFSKPVRRLPYYGIASIATGVTSIAISHFRQR